MLHFVSCPDSSLNSALAENLQIKAIGRLSFTGDTVTVAGNTRTSQTVTFPSTVTSHSFCFPVGVSSGNGYIQATWYNTTASQMTILYHSILSSDDNRDISPTINMVYIDYDGVSATTQEAGPQSTDDPDSPTVDDPEGTPTPED